MKHNVTTQFNDWDSICASFLSIHALVSSSAAVTYDDVSGPVDFVELLDEADEDYTTLTVTGGTCSGCELDAHLTSRPMPQVVEWNNL